MTLNSEKKNCRQNPGFANGTFETNGSKGTEDAGNDIPDTCVNAQEGYTEDYKKAINDSVNLLRFVSIFTDEDNTTTKE